MLGTLPAVLLNYKYIPTGIPTELNSPIDTTSATVQELHNTYASTSLAISSDVFKLN